MFTEKSISRIFSVLFVIVFILAVTPLQAAHAAGVRYAKPIASGTGDCSGWANACTLQTALTGAVSGDEIWAAAGVYEPTAGTDRTATFQLIDGVAVYGGFAGTETARSQRNPAVNVTILSGDIGIVGNFSDNSYHVVTGATGATLDGFTITAGKAHGTFLNEFGGGMYNYSSSPTLTNVTFSGNSAIYGGGMYNANSSPTLTDVTFTNNSAFYGGGGMYNANSSPVLTNATFNGNGAFYNGGGMGNDQSFPSFTNVLFNGTSANDGGGMYNDASGPVLTNVTFINNSAASGGGMYNANSSPMLTDVSFSGNSATGQSQGFGGGMYNESGSSPTMTNVTFSNNSAGGRGGGMYNDTSNPALSNVTFSGNSAQFGGGMDNENSNPTLTDVSFSGNSAVAYDGGGMDNWNSSSPMLTNVTFSGNSAYRGGGMFNGTSCSPTLTNVTFNGNTANDRGWGYGGGMYNYYSSSPQIRNTIFWGNTSATAGAQIYTEESSTPSVSDSVVQDGYGGGTNIIPTDPKLGTLGNYGGFTQTIPLLAGSSAIDTGNDSVCPATDQRGVVRPQGMHCDIGAYEVDTTAPMVNSISRFNPSPTNLASVDFTTTFSEAVTGVGVADFSLTTTGVSSASVTGVSGSGSVYTVTVNAGSGNGTIRLDVPFSATITDLAGNPLAGLPYTGGDTYTITKVFTIFLPLILH